MNQTVQGDRIGEIRYNSESSRNVLDLKTQNKMNLEFSHLVVVNADDGLRINGRYLVIDFLEG